MPMPKCGYREFALVVGLTTYFTGKPCKHGHIAPRNTADHSCVSCRELTRVALRQHSTEYMRTKRAALTPEEREIARAEWAAYQRAARQKDPERFRARERHHGRLRRQRYPQRKLAEVRARQAAKLQRTPPWADLRAIRDFYENCPAGHEVDHTIPLRGKTVSGLHVLANLQYLPKQENRLKGNRFEPERLAA